METLEVLQALPSRLQWLVFFRLSSIIRFVEPEVIRHMFFLRDDADLSLYSHVVLTSEGRYLAQIVGKQLIPVADELLPLKKHEELSIFAQYESQLSTLPLHDADCIGIGRNYKSQPAFLHVKLEMSHGEATAVLSQMPSERHYDLLPAIGVEYLGGEMTSSGYIARFRNRLATHVKAGVLSGFTRTENCNHFFIEHAEVNAQLAQGLQSAFRDRLASGRHIIKTFLHKLAVKAMASPLAMTCVPPPPESPFPYGDVVPLGFLTRGIKAITQCHKAPALLLQVHEDLNIKKLARFVDDAKSDGLWAFHRGRLITATDSALVLLGVLKSAPCEALEAFADGLGAYLPQLSAEGDVYGKMESDFSNAHWRQADFATTCLIRGLRAESRLTTKTPSSVIAKGFDRRSGLFFANPYLVDWCTALALKGDKALAHLQDRLLEEILSSANPDGSYGQYDTGLSTGLAILCMDSVGYRGPALRLAQIRLLNLLDTGPWPISTPFYSTFMCPKNSTPTTEHIICQGSLHALSLYRDGYRIVFSGVTGMALAVDSEVVGTEGPILRGNPHPRYRCNDFADYVARFALPPYIESLDGVSRPDALVH
jgi:hypothetical protein